MIALAFIAGAATGVALSSAYLHTRLRREYQALARDWARLADREARHSELLARTVQDLARIDPDQET